MSVEGDELYSLLVPLYEDRLIVPRACGDLAHNAVADGNQNEQPRHDHCPRPWYRKFESLRLIKINLFCSH